MDIRVSAPFQLQAEGAIRLDYIEGRRETFKALWLGMEYIYCSAVSGHIAEFGTMSGETSSVLALGIATFGTRYGYSDQAHGIGPRSLYLLDSFEGLPRTSNKVDAASPHVGAGIWGPGVAKGIGAQLLREKCAVALDPARIIIVEGWYDHTLKTLDPLLRFAFVHLDCDLYESTAPVLDHLFRNKSLSDGCALFFDDWYCNRGSPLFGQQKAWAECVKKYNVQFTD